MELDRDNMMLRKENKRLYKLLGKQSSQSDNLQKSNGVLASEIGVLERDLSLAKQMEEEYNKKNTRQQSQIDVSQVREADLERSLNHILKELELDREERDTRHRRELEDLTDQLADATDHLEGTRAYHEKIKFHAKGLVEQRVSEPLHARRANDLSRLVCNRVRKCV